MTETADLVVVGGGTIGGWASYFARHDGAGEVVVLERDLVGRGASSRAAGIVRAQGGTPEAVHLGRWSVDFYERQQDLLGIDSGFRRLGYILLAITEDDVAEAQRRVAMQRELGLDVSWFAAEEISRLSPSLAPEGHLGGSFVATDGAIDPPRNVLAYTVAMSKAGVDLRERTTFLGLRTEPTSSGARVVGVETSAGPIATERVLLTGGPTLRAIGDAIGARIPVGGARHQVAVTEPHPSFEADELPMVFDVGAGLYWRLEEGGLLFGMSNPAEPPGEAREIDWPYLEQMRTRLARFVPHTRGLGLRKVWAATIDFTPDHMPILGPVITAGGELVEGATVAAAGGHGMMWGPAIARAGADLVMTGRTEIVNTTDLGLDRFDAEGRSRLAPDPIALPFPPSADESREHSRS